MLKLGPIEKLGTIWWFELFDVSEKLSSEIEKQLVEQMEEFEQAYSRFRSDSNLSILNRDKKFAHPSEEFVDLLTIARQAYQDTDGVFNIAIKNQLDSIGYDSSYSFVAKAEQIVPKLSEVLKFDREGITLSNESSIDLGGFGKGYLIDKLAKWLQTNFACQQFVINGGGDMFVTEEAGKPVEIALQHPQETTLLGTLSLQHQGFAASSPFVRSWKDKAGTPHHHLVGNEHAEAVYVVAPTAMEADIWATTLAIKQDIKIPDSVQSWKWDKNTEALVKLQ